MYYKKEEIIEAGKKACNVATAGLHSAMIAIKAPVRSGAKQAGDVQKALRMIRAKVNKGMDILTACEATRQAMDYADTAEDMIQAANDAIWQGIAEGTSIGEKLQAMEDMETYYIGCGHPEMVWPEPGLDAIAASVPYAYNAASVARQVYDDKKGGRYDASMFSMEEIEALNDSHIGGSHIEQDTIYTKHQAQELARKAAARIRQPQKRPTAAKVFFMKLQGYTTREIEARTDISRSTIARMIETYLEPMAREEYTA